PRRQAEIPLNALCKNPSPALSNPAALIANPGPDGSISFREALLAANNAVGPHTISFAVGLAGATISLTTRFAPITRDGISIVGLTNNNQPRITIDAGAASNPGAIFFVAASSFAMSGLRFSSIPLNFNGVQIGGSGYTLMGQPVSSPPFLHNF